MTFRTFFIVALLQFIAAFAVAVKILQEIFISNVNFLSEFDFSLPMPVLLSFALIALLLVRQWFSELRVMLACAAMLAFASLLCVGASSGSLFFWLLCFVANVCFCFMSAEIMIAGSLRPARIPVIIINAVAMALLFIDWRVFLVTRAHLNLKILTEVLQVRTLLLRSASYMGVDGQQIVFDLVFLLALPVLCALFAGYIAARPAAKLVGWAMTSMAIMLAVVHYLSFNAVCAKVSLVEYIPVRLSTGLIPLPLHPVLQNSGALQKALSASPLIDNEKCYQSAKIDWPDNGCEKIVFIGIESLRYDAFASLMPNLKNIAARGKLFCDHYSTSNISLSSFYSIMHANFPVNLIFSDKLSKRSAFEEAAIRAGYQTVLIKPDLVSDSEFEYWSQSQIVEKIDKPWRSTPVILDRTLEQLRKPGKGVYLSYIFNTHFNYFYPPETELFTPVCAEDANIFMLPPTEENIQQIRNRYKNSVLWADKCLSAFFKAVYDEGIDKKTLFVIFGDHGQSLRENGCLGHSTGAHQLQYRVPLIVVGRGVVPAEISAPSSHMNILGAVSEYAGFRIISSFAGIADKYPLLALDESVMGRVLVIHENFINIFDLASNNRLRWIALMGRNYNLTPELVKAYYEDVDKLAETVAADFSFITAAFARQQSN